MGLADAMICGTFGTHRLHLHYVDQVIGRRPGATVYGAMNILMLPGRQVAIVDTHVNIDPSAEQVAELTVMAAEQLRRLGVVPRVALLSHSNFGSSDAPSALKMREALALLRERAPELKVDGEMHADCALDPAMRRTIMPNSTLDGEANLLVCPGIDAANIAYNLLKTTAGNNVAIGPILLGAAKPLHILTASATVRRIINMTALAVLDANSPRQPSLPLG
jgi:malate dehydrogenase (oxaloacetate-decarboxylating)(NADP+)